MSHANGISKTFGDKTILSNINLSLHRGEIVGLVGKNGAGKSTLMKILTGEIKTDKGSVHKEQGNIGCIPQYPVFSDDKVGIFLMGNHKVEYYEVDIAYLMKLPIISKLKREKQLKMHLITIKVHSL